MNPPLLSSAMARTAISRSRGELRDPVLEADYLDATLPETWRRLRLCWLLVTVSSLAYIGKDALALEPWAVWVSAIVRLIGVAPGLALLVAWPPTSGGNLQTRALVSVLAFLPAFVGVQWLYDGVSLMSPLWFSMIMILNGLWLAHSSRNLVLSNTIALASGIVSFLLLTHDSIDKIAGVMVMMLASFAFSMVIPAMLMAARRREYRTLLSVFPSSIVRRLLGDGPVADHHDAVTVFFADVVGFTSLAERIEPAALLPVLAELFETADRLAVERGVETIKTIGDRYMAASGVPAGRVDHVEAAAELALALQEIVASQTFAGQKLQLRMGLHFGPVVAGVVGVRRQLYDLWGDTVNVASRVESLGTPGEIHVSDVVAEVLRGRYALEPRPPLALRGRDDMKVWALLGRL